MKKTLSIILTLILAISVISNYQVSFAAPGKDKENNNGMHLNDKEKPSNGNNPKYENEDDIVIDYPDGSDSETSQPGKNKGGVNKIEIIDEDGDKIKSKNYKINDTDDKEIDDEEIDDEEINDEEIDDEEIDDEEIDDEEIDDEETDDEEIDDEEIDDEEIDDEEIDDEEIDDEEIDDEEIDDEEIDDEEIDDEEIDDEKVDDKEPIIEDSNNGGSTLTIEIPLGQLQIPQGTPTVVINEGVPASAPPATLPKTGNASSIAVSGLGSVIMALGLLIGGKKKD